MSVFNQFDYPSPSNSDAYANIPAFTHDSQQMILPTATSHIAGHVSSAVYTFSNTANKLCQTPVHQLFTDEGRLFIEYKPGHNVVFVDNQIAADQTLRAARLGLTLSQASGGIRKRRSKALRGVAIAGMPKKPHNAFIRYRCHYLQQTKQAHSAASQTELSRIIAEHWRNEKPETKQLFQAEYQAELSRYQAGVKEFQAQHPLGS
ncbi:hypothetical protein GGH91_005107 [Coemansia sp. RSA 2671]|nr:hypothetical protein GGH91_005107 [Coemansia sp. RSA 2671]